MKERLVVCLPSRLGCLKGPKLTDKKNDLQKEVSFSPDILVMHMRKSYAEIVRKGMDEKHPLISFYPKVKM